MLEIFINSKDIDKIELYTKSSLDDNENSNILQYNIYPEVHDKSFRRIMHRCIIYTESEPIVGRIEYTYGLCISDKTIIGKLSIIVENDELIGDVIASCKCEITILNSDVIHCIQKFNRIRSMNDINICKVFSSHFGISLQSTCKALTNEVINFFGSMI